jgi:NADH-quinone oxidoreductase subunit E
LPLSGLAGNKPASCRAKNTPTPQIGISMIPDKVQETLAKQIKDAQHPQELAVDVLFAVQDHYGYLSDEAVAEAAALLNMTPLEIEELATFYTFLYREPVGKYVIHICDSLICWLDGYESIRDYLCQKLDIKVGETTSDGLFTLLPVCCIGYCDRAPAVLINRKVYGHLTAEKLDTILEKLKTDV